MKIIFSYLLLLACSSVLAATPVNLQTCTVVPTTGGIAGCPSANAVMGPVAPSSWVRSIVGGQQAFRPFSTLTPADYVWAGSWQLLGSITPALQSTSTPPPVVTPPVQPPATQSVVITSVDAPSTSVTFTNIPVPGCFTLNTTRVCIPSP